MHMALLSPLPPRQSGIADYARVLMEHLQAAGINVETPLANTEPHQLVSRLQTVDWSRYAVVHAELGGGGVQEFAALQWLMQHRPELPLTATVHDPERLVWRPVRYPFGLGVLARSWSPADKLLTVAFDPLTLRAERKLARHLTRAVTLTHTGGRALVERLGLDESVVAVIPHGVNQVENSQPPGLEPVRLLYFGFVYRGKGIEDILQALAALLQRRPELASRVQLTLAGGSEPAMAFKSGTSYVDELTALVEKLQLEGNVSWQLDVPEERIAGLIQQHHVMVLPYRESRKLALLGQVRGTSGALAWATACGRGVLASDARAFGEELSYGNGRVFAQGDVEALASALERLLDAPQTCQDWIAAAESLGRKRAWPVVAERFAKLFRETACVSG